MVRVAFITDDLPSMGGTRTFMFNFLRNNVLFSNYKFTLFIQRRQFDLEVEEFCKLNNINYFLVLDRFNIFNKLYFNLIYELYLFLIIKFKSNPQLFVCSIGSPRLNYLFFIFSNNSIYFLHTIPNKVSFRYKFFDFILKRSLNSRKVLVTVSNFARNITIQNFDISDKSLFVKVIHNCVGAFNIKQSAGLNSNIVLTVGHVVDYKNPFVWLDVALRVVKKHSGIKFIWLGDGPLLEDMRVLVKNNSLGNNIYFPGKVSDVAKYYRDSLIYFHPSYIESHGISILEAMSFGLPCIVSNAGGISESVEDNLNGYLIDPLDIDSFTLKILTLIEDIELMNYMGKNSKAIVYNKFSYCEFKLKLFNLFNDVLTF